MLKNFTTTIERDTDVLSNDMHPEDWKTNRKQTKIYKNGIPC